MTNEGISETIINKKSILLAAIVIVGIVGGIIFFVTKYNSSSSGASQSKNTKEEIQLLLKKINTIYDLPTGETPTIATVSDKTKLQKQQFFLKAENGDKVLIYTNAKKGILYRPSLHKIIEVSVLSINTPTDSPNDVKVSPTPAFSLDKSFTISIYNGTTISGLASTTETKLKDVYKNAKVVEKNNAIKDYPVTIVSDMTGNNKELTKNIAELLGGIVKSIPAGENTPQGEILVILGKE